MDSQDSPWPGIGRSYHLPPYNVLYDCPWGLHPNVIFPKTPNLGVPKLGLLPLWRPITSYINFQLRWGLKQSCNLHQEFFKNMWHGTWMHVIQGNFQLLLVGSQINILIPDPFFGHNLCYKYSNGSYKFILEISNGIRNFSIQLVLAPQIVFWRFRTS
jgi:hypothetical protein